MMRFGAIGAAALSPLLFSPLAWGTPYNPQAEFSNSNPSGVWSYGTINASGSTFTPFTDYSANNNATGVDVWSNLPTNSPFPGIFDNTNSTTTNVYTTIAIPGDTLVLHPPNDTDQTDLRFTAPTNLTITNIAATFAAADTSGTTTDVHLYVNGVALFNSFVNGTAGHGTVGYGSGPLVLLAGQTVDFRVGFGKNGTYFNDGTSLVASITVPEPASIALAALGSVGLLARRRHRA